MLFLQPERVLLVKKKAKTIGLKIRKRKKREMYLYFFVTREVYFYWSTPFIIGSFYYKEKKRYLLLVGEKNVFALNDKIVCSTYLNNQLSKQIFFFFRF